RRGGSVIAWISTPRGSTIWLCLSRARRCSPWSTVRCCRVGTCGPAKRAGGPTVQDRPDWPQTGQTHGWPLCRVTERYGCGTPRPVTVWGAPPCHGPTSHGLVVGDLAGKQLCSSQRTANTSGPPLRARSEERRVGKEG